MAVKDINKYFKAFYKEYNKYTEGVHNLNEGATDRIIYAFEETYNMNLPLYYKEWLKVNNGGTLFADTIGTTIMEVLGNRTRKEGVRYIEDNFDGSKRQPGMPATFFMIAYTPYGDVIGYDLEHTNLEDGKVLYWNRESGEIEEDWPNFAKWLKDEMLIGKEEVDYTGAER